MVTWDWKPGTLFMLQFFGNFHFGDRMDTGSGDATKQAALDVPTGSGQRYSIRYRCVVYHMDIAWFKTLA
jgi:hypothetical protein